MWGARVLGRVIVGGGRIRGRAELRVRWMGKPLADEARTHALEPRWEEPQAQRQGLGMALAVARRAADLHGRSLRSEPQAVVLTPPLRTPQIQPGTRRDPRL